MNKDRPRRLKKTRATRTTRKVKKVSPLKSSRSEAYSAHSAPAPQPVASPPPPPPPPPGKRHDYYRDQDYYDDYYEPRQHRSSVRPPPPPPPRQDHWEDDYYYRGSRPPAPRQRPRPRPGPGRAQYGYDHYDGYNPEARPVSQTRSHQRTAPVSKPPQYSRPSSSETGSSSGGSRGAVIVVVIILLLLFLYMFRGPIIDFIQNPPPLAYQEYPKQVDFTVEKVMTVECDPQGGSGYISFALKSACPKDRPRVSSYKIQDVLDVDVQPEPDTNYPDYQDKDQEIMVWKEDNFQSTKTFSARYTITTYFYDWELTEDDSGNIADLPAGLQTKYNHDEWLVEDNGGSDYLIEPTDPDIKNLADRLAGSEKNVYKVVKKFYDHLTSSENLNYVPSTTGLPKACTTTLQIKRGDCDDYSILFISLCRAVDIPAWLELGVLYDKNSGNWGGHAWSKVAIPLKDGGYAAPTVDIVNKQFMFFDPYRFIEWEDTGGDELYYDETEVRNNLDYYYHSFSYQSVGSPKITSPETNNFVTISLKESAEKVKVAVDDGTGLGELCMLPGFDGVFMLMGFVSVGFMIVIKSVGLRKGRRRSYD